MRNNISKRRRERKSLLLCSVLPGAAIQRIRESGRRAVMKARKKLFPKRWSAGLCLILSLISLLATACSAPTGKDSPSYIYLIRHGRTYSNEQGLLVGRGGNYDLTKEAVASAKEVGETLHEEGVEFDQAYSSTLGRAYDTAEYILEGAKEQDLKVDQMADLDDISWGDAEGYTQEEFMEKYDLDTFPDAFGSADDPNFVSPIHAESKYDFCQRFSKGMDEIIADAEEGTAVLVVAHSSMQYWLEQEFPELQAQSIDNLGVTVLRVADDDIELVEYNDTVTAE